MKEKKESAISNTSDLKFSSHRSIKWKKKKKIKKAKVTYKKNHQVDQYTDYESQKREAKGQTIYLKKCG